MLSESDKQKLNEYIESIKKLSDGFDRYMEVLIAGQPLYSDNITADLKAIAYSNLIQIGRLLRKGGILTEEQCKILSAVQKDVVFFMANDLLTLLPIAVQILNQLSKNSVIDDNAWIELCIGNLEHLLAEYQSKEYLSEYAPVYSTLWHISWDYRENLVSFLEETVEVLNEIGVAQFTLLQFEKLLNVDVGLQKARFLHRESNDIDSSQLKTAFNKLQTVLSYPEDEQMIAHLEWEWTGRIVDLVADIEEFAKKLKELQWTPIDLEQDEIERDESIAYYVSKVVTTLSALPEKLIEERGDAGRFSYAEFMKLSMASLTLKINHLPLEPMVFERMNALLNNPPLPREATFVSQGRLEGPDDGKPGSSTKPQ